MDFYIHNFAFSFSNSGPTNPSGDPAERGQGRRFGAAPPNQTILVNPQFYPELGSCLRKQHGTLPGLASSQSQDVIESRHTINKSGGCVASITF